jgi:hypothetical protein
MQQVHVTDGSWNEKLDCLIRTFLSRTEGTMGYDEFCGIGNSPDIKEDLSLRDRLLDDSILCLKVSPNGLEISLTESGIEFIVMGGYSRTWVTRLENPRMQENNWRGVIILGLFYLALFAGAYFSLKK